MYVEYCDASCGVKALTYLGDSSGAADMRKATKLSEFFDLLYGVDYHGIDCGFQNYEPGESLPKGYVYVFSDNIQNGNGARIAKWIKKYKLGLLTSIGPNLNPNTGRMITTYLWRYNGRKPTAEQQAEVGYEKPGKPSNEWNV